VPVTRWIHLITGNFHPVILNNIIIPILWTESMTDNLNFMVQTYKQLPQSMSGLGISKTEASLSLFLAQDPPDKMFYINSIQSH
jgi:hypothetical protein